jgi:hypothetical protein
MIARAGDAARTAGGCGMTGKLIVKTSTNPIGSICGNYVTIYFWKGETNNWLDRTVDVPKVSSLSLEQWIDEFKRLQKLNSEMLAGKVLKKETAHPKPRTTKARKS